MAQWNEINAQIKVSFTYVGPHNDEMCIMGYKKKRKKKKVIKETYLKKKAKWNP